MSAVKPTLLWFPVLSPVLAAFGWAAGGTKENASSNLPPAVHISWPKDGANFTAGTSIRIKAETYDPDGMIAQVQFFAETNLIHQAPQLQIVKQIVSGGRALAGERNGSPLFAARNRA